jgi:tetratricopeptide (TPR) repeat protein
VSRRNLLIRLGIYPVVALLAGGMLWAFFGAQRRARAEAQWKQARTELSLGLWENAERSARDAVGLDATSPQAWAALGEILGRRARRQSGDAAALEREGRDALERAVTLSGADPGRLLDVADAATKAGVFAVAEQATNTVLEAHGPTPNALWFRGRARWFAAADDAGRGPARADLERACTESTTSELPAQIGAFAVFFDDVALATHAAQRLRGVAPEEPEGAAIDAWLAEHRGDIPGALRCYGEAVKLATEREQHRPAATLSATEARRRFLGELYFRRGGLRFAQEPKSAVADLDAAFDLNAESPIVAHLAAQARLAAGRPADAADALARAWRGSLRRPALRKEIVAQVRAGTWDALPPSPLRDTLRAAAKQ